MKYLYAGAGGLFVALGTMAAIESSWLIAALCLGGACLSLWWALEQD